MSNCLKVSRKHKSMSCLRLEVQYFQKCVYSSNAYRHTCTLRHTLASLSDPQKILMSVVCTAGSIRHARYRLVEDVHSSICPFCNRYGHVWLHAHPHTHTRTHTHPCTLKRHGFGAAHICNKTASLKVLLLLLLPTIHTTGSKSQFS